MDLREQRRASVGGQRDLAAAVAAERERRDLGELRIGERLREDGLRAGVARAAERLERDRFVALHRGDDLLRHAVDRQVLGLVVERGRDAERADRRTDDARLAIGERLVEHAQRVTPADPAEAAQREHARVEVAAAGELDELGDAAGAPRLGTRDLHAHGAIVVGHRRTVHVSAWTTAEQRGCSNRDRPQHARILH